MFDSDTKTTREIKLIKKKHVDPRFTHDNTVGATFWLLNDMNRMFDEMAGDICDEVILNKVTDVVIRSHGGIWDASKGQVVFSKEDTIFPK